jgi:hypothetical protein
MEEIWKDVYGFEGVFRISNLGRFESVPRYYLRGGTTIMFIKGGIVEGNNIYSHKSLSLKYKDKLLKTSIHRLAYTMFVGEIKKGYVINHINGIKSDNRVVNLEMITQSENILHAYETGLIKRKCKKKC